MSPFDAVFVGSLAGVAAADDGKGLYKRTVLKGSLTVDARARSFAASRSVDGITDGADSASFACITVGGAAVVCVAGCVTVDCVVVDIASATGAGMALSESRGASAVVAVSLVSRASNGLGLTVDD